MTSRTRFRNLLILDALEPPERAAIDAIERELGAALPTSFVDFLNVANGAYHRYVIDVPIDQSNSEEIGFGMLFYAGQKGKNRETFLESLLMAKGHGSIPAGVLPIARDGGGSTVFLDLTSRGRGRVVALVTGLPEWAGLRRESAFLELAGDFDEYLEMLRVSRSEAIDILEREVATEDCLNEIVEWLDLGVPDWRSDVELSRSFESAAGRIRSGKSQSTLATPQG